VPLVFKRYSLSIKKAVVKGSKVECTYLNCLVFGRRWLCVLDRSFCVPTEHIDRFTESFQKNDGG